ncbi:MAG: ABC transporter ATP-binding protein [Sellimonas intestinalis]
MDILSIRELTKSFGSRTVIDHLHLSVPAHSVFGFIGKNGAGKTTTMRMIVGLLKPDHGEIQVNGERVSFGENQTNRYIGYLPDVPEYYGFMTASQYLTLCGEITGMQSSDVRRRILDLLDLVGLTDSKKHIHTYSRGMKQRLGIAQALLNAPKLLICDEPTSALDPVGRKEILDIPLLSLRRRRCFSPPTCYQMWSGSVTTLPCCTTAASSSRGRWRISNGNATGKKSKSNLNVVLMQRPA